MCESGLGCISHEVSHFIIECFSDVSKMCVCAQRFRPTVCCLSVSLSMRVFIGGRSDHEQHDY